MKRLLTTEQRLKIVTLIILSFIIANCSLIKRDLTELSREPSPGYPERDPKLALPDRMTNSQIDIEISNQLKNRYGLYVNTPLETYIQKIAIQLLQSNKQSSDISVKIQLLDSLDILAFSSQQGSIWLSKGLLASLSNEDQLAAVLAHELAHTLLHHHDSIHKINYAQWLESESLAQTIDTKQGKSASRYFGAIKRARNEQLQEFHADDLAIKLLSQAGHTPHALASFLNMLIEDEKYQINKSCSSPVKSSFDYHLLDSHPSSKSRFNNIHKTLKETTRTVSSRDINKSTERYYKAINGLELRKANAPIFVDKNEVFLLASGINFKTGACWDFVKSGHQSYDIYSKHQQRAIGSLYTGTSINDQLNSIKHHAYQVTKRNSRSPSLIQRAVYLTSDMQILSTYVLGNNETLIVIKNDLDNHLDETLAFDHDLSNYKITSKENNHFFLSGNEIHVTEVDQVQYERYQSQLSKYSEKLAGTLGFMNLNSFKNSGDNQRKPIKLIK